MTPHQELCLSGPDPRPPGLGTKVLIFIRMRSKPRKFKQVLLRIHAGLDLPSCAFGFGSAQANDSGPSYGSIVSVSVMRYPTIYSNTSPPPPREYAVPYPLVNQTTKTTLGSHMFRFQQR
jgi:hypothetical protein